MSASFQSLVETSCRLGRFWQWDQDFHPHKLSFHDISGFHSNAKVKTMHIDNYSPQNIILKAATKIPLADGSMTRNFVLCIYSFWACWNVFSSVPRICYQLWDHAKYDVFPLMSQVDAARTMRNLKVHVNPKIHYIFGPVVVKCLLWISKDFL